jgi:hypothetical protein
VKACGELINSSWEVAACNLGTTKLFLGAFAPELGTQQKTKRRLQFDASVF